MAEDPYAQNKASILTYTAFVDVDSSYPATFPSLKILSQTLIPAGAVPIICILSVILLKQRPEAFKYMEGSK